MKRQRKIVVGQSSLTEKKLVCKIKLASRLIWNLAFKLNNDRTIGPGGTLRCFTVVEGASVASQDANPGSFYS